MNTSFGVIASYLRGDLYQDRIFPHGRIYGAYELSGLKTTLLTDKILIYMFDMNHGTPFAPGRNGHAISENLIRA